MGSESKWTRPDHLLLASPGAIRAHPSPVLPSHFPPLTRPASHLCRFLCLVCYYLMLGVVGPDPSPAPGGPPAFAAEEGASLRRRRPTNGGRSRAIMLRIPATPLGLSERHPCAPSSDASRLGRSLLTAWLVLGFHGNSDGPRSCTKTGATAALRTWNKLILCSVRE